jgi:uncharacterized protein YkwD
MKKLTTLILLILFIMIALPTDANASSQLNIFSRQQMSGGEVISAINGYRQQYGLPALSQNSLLSSLAQSQSDYQASITTVTHTGPGGTTPQERATAAGYGGGNFFYLSEIIYGGYNQTTQDALVWWQNSSLHNSIMLSSNYSEIGAGVAVNGENVYFTAVLGGPTGGSTSTGGEGDNPDPGVEGTTQPAPAGQVTLPIQTATPQADGAIVHTILTGQSLWTIAAVYEVELTKLYEINGLNQSSFVFPGDQILIRPPGSYENIEATPTGMSETGQPKETSTQLPQISTQLLGTPFSSVDDRAPQNLASNSPEPITAEISATEVQQKYSLFSEDPIARNLIIAAFVILIIVLVGSMFIQKPPPRPSKED